MHLVGYSVYMYVHMYGTGCYLKNWTHAIHFVSAYTPSRSERPEARAWTNLQQQCQSHRQNWYVIWMNGNASPCQFELPPRNYLPLRFQRTTHVFAIYRRRYRVQINALQSLKNFFHSIHRYVLFQIDLVKYVVLTWLALRHKTHFFFKKNWDINLYYLHSVNL